MAGRPHGLGRLARNRLTGSVDHRGDRGRAEEAYRGSRPAGLYSGAEWIAQQAAYGAAARFHILRTNSLASCSSEAEPRSIVSNTCWTHCGPCPPIDLQNPSTSPTGTIHKPAAAQALSIALNCCV